MKKLVMTFIGSFVLIFSLAGPTDAQAIHYGLANIGLDGATTAMANGAHRLEETISFVNDCDYPPCTSFDIRPALNNSVTAIDRISYTPNVLFRSEDYHDSNEFDDKATYPVEYKIEGSSYFLSLCFHEDTHNVMTLWNYEDESPSIAVSDSILMFLFGISCVIGLFDSNTPQKKSTRAFQKRKRMVHR